jgi:hypothetical protein
MQRLTLHRIASSLLLPSFAFNKVGVQFKFLLTVKSQLGLFFSFDTLKRAFVGVHKVIQANDKSECAQDAVEEILRSTDRN